MARPNQRPTLGVALLAMQVMNYGVDRLPPVTLATIAGQVAIYLRFVPVPWTAATACLSARKILNFGDYWTLLFSVLEHADDIHLYYNMASYMSKGRSLELQMGSKRFALLQTVFTACCGFMYVLLAVLASELDDPGYLDQCSIGFSGVIFALKVLTTFDSPNYTTIVPGVQIPLKWLVWIELLLIQMLTPNASFIGHLAGILVGLLYVFGPLKYVINCLDNVIFGIGQRAHYTRRFNRGDYYHEYEGNNLGGAEFFMPGQTEEEQMAEALRRSREDRGARATRPPPPRRTEEEQMAEALRRSREDRGARATRPPPPPADHEENFWTAFNSAEDAEMQRAMYESLKSNSNAPPPRHEGEPRQRPLRSNSNAPPPRHEGEPRRRPTVPSNQRGEPSNNIPQQAEERRADYDADYVRRRRQERFQNRR